jgi:hypothetical protein
MLAGGRLAHPGLLGQLTHGQLAVHHQPEDGPAGRMGERFDRGLHDDILAILHIRFSAYELVLRGGLRNRNPEVDRWFEQAGHPLEATMRRARDIILGADGRVTESIKWKTPTFAYNGNIASFNPSKYLLSIMFHRGAEIPGEHPRLEGDGTPHHALHRPRQARGRQGRLGGRRPRLVRLESGSSTRS